MLKKYRWVVLLSIIIFLSILYPISVYSSFFLASQQKEQSNITFNGKVIPGIRDNSTTHPVVEYSTYTLSKANLYASSKVVLFAISINYTKIPPFTAYTVDNFKVTNLGILTEYNISISLDLKNGVHIIKHVEDTISLNNKSKILSIIKMYNWTSSTPSLSGFFNAPSEKHYILKVKISDSESFITSGVLHTSSEYQSGQGEILIKYINFGLVSTIYAIILFLSAMVLGGFYILSEFRKYYKIKDSKSNFLLYLKSNITRYSNRYSKSKKLKKITLLSEKIFRKLEEIEEENKPLN